MPLIRVHGGNAVPSNIGGTVEVEELDLTEAWTVTLSAATYNAKGNWTIFRYTSLLGSLSNLTVTHPTRAVLSVIDTGTSIVARLA
jgi:hypothetical protein